VSRFHGVYLAALNGNDNGHSRSVHVYPRRLPSSQSDTNALRANSKLAYNIRCLLPDQTIHFYRQDDQNMNLHYNETPKSHDLLDVLSTVTS
jgi:hypothetical protein